MADYLVQKKDIRSNEKIAKHADWAETFSGKYDEITEENVMDILKKKSVKYSSMYLRMPECISVQKKDGKRF